MSSAATITAGETLKLLDGPFASFAQGVAEDRYALWLGSGISFGRVEGLKQVVPRVVEFLREKIAVGNRQCRFGKALDRVLGLAQLSEVERQRIDLALPFVDWPDAPTITNRLVTNYARLLDTAVDGEPDDYLLWEAVGVVATFANPAIEPDVEHLCIAILVLEGVSSTIASANWDGLVERAVSMLASGNPSIVVCVRSEDLRDANLKAHLFKFHGCAVKAAFNEGVYRPYLIARQSQINRWITSAENAPMVTRLTDLITTKPTLMMGLSAQDANIQALFAKAEASMAWPWPGDRPSYVFSEQAMGVDQEGLLKNVYRTASSPETRQQISEGALIRAYAKPLLIALVLHAFCTKLKTLIDLAPGSLGQADRKRLQQGLITLRDRMAKTVGTNHLEFIQSLITQSGQLITMYRDGRIPQRPAPYNPITPVPVQQIAGDVALPASGLREAAIAIGILGVGVSDGIWTLNGVSADDPEAGMIRVDGPARSAKVFFAANSSAALSLRHNGHVVDSDNPVLIHSREIAPEIRRSPSSAPGRTGQLGLRQVSIAALLKETTNADELIQRFREEVAV